MARTISLDQVESFPRSQGVTVRRLIWDWNDPSEVVGLELLRIGSDLHRGCWFLNPMFKVHSPESTRAFLQEVRRRQSEWFRVLTRQFGSANWRRMMLATKDLYQRRLGFAGILMVQGREIHPHSQYRLEAQLGLRPESDFVVSRRPHAYRCFKEQDWESLKEISRSDLEQQLRANPKDPVYVCPIVTVMGLRADPAFYEEVEKRCGEWHGHLNRLLGGPGRKEMARQADWATRMLVFNGTLVVDGLIYVPGCWPNRPLKKKLKMSPFGSPTVLPEYLGLCCTCKATTVGGPAAS